MQLDPRHIIAFAHLIEAGSFTEAAKQLGSTQPAISKLVSDLERRMGVALLEQRKNPVLPTQSGKILADSGRELRRQLAETAASLSDVSSGNVGVIRLGLPPFFGEDLIPDLLACFLKATPRARFVVRSGYLPEMLRALQDNQIDLALGPIGPQQQDKRYEKHVLVRHDHVVVGRKGHPLAAEKEVTASMLSQAVWALQDEASILSRMTRDSLAWLGVTNIEPALISDSGPVLLRLVEASDCLTLLPTMSAFERLRSGHLSILPTRELPVIEFGATSNGTRSMQPIVRKFLDFLETELAAKEREIEVWKATQNIC